MESLITTKTKVKIDNESKSITRPSLLSILLISSLIVFIFSFMVVDYMSLNKKIDSKVVVVTDKLDSLNTYTTIKSVSFDKNYKIQQEQLKKAKSLGK